MRDGIELRIGNKAIHFVKVNRAALIQTERGLRAQNAFDRSIDASLADVAAVDGLLDGANRRVNIGWFENHIRARFDRLHC